MAMEYEVRYFMEHKALPQALRTHRESLLLELLGGAKAIGALYAKAEDSNPDYTCPYDISQFTVTFHEYIDGKNAVFIVRVGMPEPECSPLCRAVYVCFSGGGHEDLYFTSELTPEGQYFLCCWPADGVHLNFGDAPKDEFAKVAELFWELNRNGDSSKHKGLCRGGCQLPT